jgi:hypothetical protein
MEFFGIVIRSRQELKDFYGWLHSYVKESVTLLNFAASETCTACDAVVRIEAIRDLSREELDAHGAFGFFPIAAGDVQEIRQFIFYTTRNGQIEKVEAALPPQDRGQKICSPKALPFRIPTSFTSAGPGFPRTVGG